MIDHPVGTAARLPVRFMVLLDAGKTVLGVDGLAVMLTDDGGSLRLAAASDGVSAAEREELAAGLSPGLATPIPPTGPSLGSLYLFRHHDHRDWDDDDRRCAAAYADVIGALLALTATERRRGEGA